MLSTDVLYGAPPTVSRGGSRPASASVFLVDLAERVRRPSRNPAASLSSPAANVSSICKKRSGYTCGTSPLGHPFQEVVIRGEKKTLTAFTDKKILLVPAHCFWCRSTTRYVIVQSRSGRFVSKDCEACGRSRLLSRSELPAIDCQRCSVALEATYDFDRNYAYRCVSCRRNSGFGTSSPTGPNFSNTAASLWTAISSESIAPCWTLFEQGT